MDNVVKIAIDQYRREKANAEADAARNRAASQKTTNPSEKQQLIDRANAWDLVAKVAQQKIDTFSGR
jgi:hypothetical protein